MFASLKAVVALVVATASLVSVSAYPTIHAREGSCSTGTMQCCSSIAPAGSDDAAMLNGLLPLNLQGLAVPLGANCVPLSMMGAGSSGTCSAQAACCDGVHDEGGDAPVGVNCSPINTGI